MIPRALIYSVEGMQHGEVSWVCAGPESGPAPGQELELGPESEPGPIPAPWLSVEPGLELGLSLSLGL